MCDEFTLREADDERIAILRIEALQRGYDCMNGWVLIPEWRT
jgi:hypothetical protein